MMSVKNENENNLDDYKFPIVNLPFICSNIPVVPAYGVHISQLVRHSRTCGFYQDFMKEGSC
jgi:DNA-directed RNA polymerase subunit H (RpoH/RPB5)